jgi:putative molybdopterin biosynthesis protein
LADFLFKEPYHWLKPIQICIFIHMNKIKVEPNWTFTDSSGQQLSPQLFALLHALKKSEKLTDAAKQIGISYRHGWNLIKQWTDFFGTPLVEMQKGRGAKLTILGEKLLWAEERVQARLGPQMENLATELNLEIHKALEIHNPILSLYASHGYAVALLPEHIEELELNLQYMPAEQAIRAVIAGECDIAGFHLPRGVGGSQLIEQHKRQLLSDDLTVIRYITRQQGLIVQSGNPKQIKSLNDLIRSDVRFINRQEGSGTSALFNELIHRAELDPEKINGYTTREFTHSAVAAYVASGMADVGLGVEPPARNFGLDFIPLALEHYLLVCKTNRLEHPPVKALIGQLTSPGLTSAIEALPGYQLDGIGSQMSTDKLFAAIT